MKINPLDPSVIKKLRSDVAFVSVSHCVEELVWNSIDAGANCIAVRLNLPFYKIQVIDNGNGIPSDQMALVGKRYATSKCHSLEDLQNLQYGGFRGEALSSLKDIASNLMIESRASGSSETYCKIFNHGKSSIPTISVNPRPSKGTTVTVFNFMYNRPVRKNAISEAIDLEETRKLLQSIALVHPSISFSLLNEANGDMCLQFKKCTSMYFAFMQLFGRERAKSLRSLDHHVENYKINGFISTDCFSSKNFQFLYVNGRLILKTRLHKLINSLLNKTLCSKQKPEFDVVQSTPKFFSPSKSQYCCFILNIVCPRDVYDTVFDRKRTVVEFSEWEKVSNLVQNSVIGFLKEHNIIPDSSIQTKDLIPNLSNAEDDNNCLLNLGVDNFRNGLFSNAVKRQIVTTNAARNSMDVFPYQMGINEKITQSDSQRERKAEVSMSDRDGTNTQLLEKHVALNTACHSNSVVGKDHAREYSISKSLSPNRNFISLRNTDFKPSILDDLKRNSDRNATTETKNDGYASEALSTTSTIESDSDILHTNRSVFQTQNPVILRVPIKSTLSLLQKESRNSNALQKLKEKYSFSPKKHKRNSGILYDSVHPLTKEHRRLNSSILQQKPDTDSVPNCTINAKADCNIVKETTFFQSPKVTVKDNFRIASKFKFNGESTISPLKRFCRSKKSKILTSASVCSSEIKDIAKNMSNDLEIGMNLETEKRLPDDTQDFFIPVPENEILDNSTPSSIFHTLYDEIDSDKIIKEKNLGVSKCRSYVDDSNKNPKLTVSKSNNFNPFFRPLYDTEMNHSMDHNTFNVDKLMHLHDQFIKSKKPLLIETEKSTSNNKNNSFLKKLQDCAQLVMPQSYVQFNQQKSCQGTASHKSISISAAINNFACDCETSAKECCVTDSSEIKDCSTQLQNDTQTLVKDSEFNCVPFILNPVDVKSATGDLSTFYCINYNDSQSSETASNKEHANSVSNLCSGSSSSLFDLCTSFNDEASPTVPVSAFSEFKNAKYQNLTSLEKIVTSDSSINEFDTFAADLNEFTSQDKCDTDGTVSKVPKSKPTHVFRSVQNQENVKKIASDSPKIVESLPVNVLNEHSISPKGKKTCCETDLHKEKYNFDSLTDAQNDDCNLSKAKELALKYASGDFVSGINASINNMPIHDKPLKVGVITNEASNLPSDEPLASLSSDMTLKHLTKQHLETIEEETIDVTSADSKSSSSEPLLNETNRKRWICQVDEDTKQVAYIDSLTGNSTYLEPDMLQNRLDSFVNEEPVTGFIKKPHFFLTHDFSPFVSKSMNPSEFLEADDDICDLKIDLNSYIEDKEFKDWNRKWRYPETGINASDDIKDMFKDWENPMFDIPSEVNSLEKPKVPVCLPHMFILNSYRFTQSSLNTLKVIGQVDCKFIACIIQDFNDSSKNKRLLALFDQHAVHERIRLEELTEDLYEMRENKKCVKKVAVSPHLKVSLEPEEIRLLHTYHASLEDIGFCICFGDDENNINVSSLPSCFVDNKSNQLRKRIPEAETLVEKIIKEWLDTLMQTRSVSSILPKTLGALLNSQACRGAVKFGDPLDLSQCKHLLDALAKCKLPFQCAHGRPSIAPVLDLNKIESLSQKRAFPKLWKLKQTHEPSHQIA